MDNVTEGMQNYGGKINAVETDLKKLGTSTKHELISNLPLCFYLQQKNMVWYKQVNIF